MAHTRVLSFVAEPTLAPGLLGFALDAPRPGEAIEHFAIELEGWVLGRERKVERVDVFLDDARVGSAAVWLPREDLARLQPDHPHAGQAGFHVSVNLIGLPQRFDLNLRAVFGDDTSVQLGSLAVEHDPVDLGLSPRRQPILVTALGRSGTTWLMRLLVEHPDIVMHCNYPFEPIAAWYVLHSMRILTTPSNPIRQEDRHRIRESTDMAYTMPLFCKWEEPELHRWMRTEYVKNWAGFAIDTIDRFYDRVAELRGRPEATYYCEKALGLTRNRVHVSAVFAELYPRLREIFVVRDFRDVVCSRRSFFSQRKGPLPPIDEFIRDVANRAQTLLDNWKLRHGKAHLVRYEDLIRNPVGSLQELFGFLKLDNSAPLVRRMLESANQNPGIASSHRTVSDPLRTIGRYRKDLERTELRYCEEQLEGVLDAFGYADAA